MPGLVESSPCAALMVCQQHVPRQDLGLKAFLVFLSGVVVFTAAVLNAPLGLFCKES